MEPFLPPELIDVVVFYVADTSPWYFVSKRCADIARKNTVDLKTACRLGRWVEVKTAMKVARNKKIAVYYMFKYGQDQLYKMLDPYDHSLNTITIVARMKGIVRRGDVSRVKLGDFKADRHIPNSCIVSASKSGNVEMVKLIPIDNSIMSIVGAQRSVQKVATKLIKTGDNRYRDVIAVLQERYNAKFIPQIVRGMILAGDVAKLKQYLILNNLNIDSVDYYATACESGSIPMFEFVSAELRKLHVNMKCESYIYSVCKSKNVDIVKHLLVLIDDKKLIVEDEEDVVAICCGGIEIYNLMEEYIEYGWARGFEAVVRKNNTEIALRVLNKMRSDDNNEVDMGELLTVAINNKNKEIAHAIVDYRLLD